MILYDNDLIILALERALHGVYVHQTLPAMNIGEPVYLGCRSAREFHPLGETMKDVRVFILLTLLASLIRRAYGNTCHQLLGETTAWRC